MPPTPSEILEDQRRHLIARLLSRNPLLSFKPNRIGRGHKIDICDLFPLENAAPFLGGGAEQQENEEYAQTAGDFFRRLIENKKASFRMEAPTLGRQIRKIRAEAEDLKRATGMDLLYFAWPFVHIPANLCGRARPIAAPLLFCPIKLIPSRQSCTVELREDENEYNFILEAWLKHKKECNLDFSQFEGKSIDEINKLINEIIVPEMRFDGKECIYKIDNPYELSPYNDEETEPAILPTAALGIAGFNSRTLLNDLEKLAQIADSDNDLGLLNIFLQPVAENDDIRQPPKGSKPEREADKHLVEKSDSSQEAVVWQARQEQAKVMFLKGPPGTGKSQTIVNLVADALSRQESVAVVCHKQAALDVVKKRLDATELGELATKVISPRPERRDFVQGIRDTPVDEHLSILPRQRNDEIESLENNCYQQSKLRMGNGKEYSVKGHLHGRIEKLSRETEFSPFIAHDHGTNDFIESIKNTFNNNLPNEQSRNGFLVEMTEFAQNYEECDFVNNPWRGSDMGGDIAVIKQSFKALAQIAKELDSKRDNLPNELFASLFFSDIMNHWSAGFFPNENRDVISKFSRLIADTKQIFAHAKMEVPKIWEEIYDGKGGDEYRLYVDNVHHLPMIASIKTRQRDSGVFNAFMNCEGIESKNWRDILDIIFCYWQFKNMVVPSLVNYDQGITDLKSLIENKRKNDARQVHNQYNKKRVAANQLVSSDLLRLRRVGNNLATSIRKLYEKGGDNVKEIYPVLLATPDAVCQITPMEKGFFDLVIIDEASQMFTADALPILYRAKKIVISGDNMQMPPDKFFAMSLDDQDDGEPEEEEQAEVIPQGSPPAYGHYELLEAVEYLLLPGSSARRELNVHYRSRPTELIAFSNHAFYGGKLQAATDNGALPPNFEQPFKLIHIPGTFNTGINAAEIDSIINELRELWESENPLSVGVIVFNVKQAQAIKGRLFEECEGDSDFKEKHDDALEQRDNGEDAGFFVRSVEHVQGDERDIIILATTYDDNKKGFGPLSKKEEGRRRLNVAVTRAKLGMIVITSLAIDRISNEGEGPDGQQGKERWYLWKFMQYVRAVAGGEQERAIEILRMINLEYRQPAVGTGVADSQFELDVGEFIQQKYTVDYQVGEGGFRIDLGIKQNNNDTAYLCGVECDGRIWHDGWRARHNDIWRQGILESKGWRIYRIWSDHWYNDPQNTQRKLLRYLNTLG